jgi:antitoxin component of MazEF toxin-antitoxin module
MITKKVTAVGNSAAILLSRDLLELMDARIGTEVQITLVGKSLVVRTLSEAEIERKFQAATEKILKEDAGLLERLSK